VPDIEGLKAVRFYTNETIFDHLEHEPGRLVVIGGGPVGCELGQAFARLGASTTIVQTAGRILGEEDEDTSRAVHDRLQAEGVRIITGATVRMVARSERVMRVWVELSTGERLPLDGDTLLVAAGREPNLEGLDLERAGVACDEHGIRVDEHLRTSRRHIFAAGDIASPYRFTHVAEAQARTIVRNLLLPRFPARWDDSIVPWCTFTDPELARVGLSERQAGERGILCDIWRRPFSEMDRAVVESRTEGFAKILTARGSDLILGAAIVGHGAGDLIHEIVLAMKAGLGLAAISETIHVYPTFAEIVRRTADERQKARLTPSRRRFTRWLFRRRRRGA
jgi:pyruvate/2-oxoglutarate dehydrogenase complex dihydrolipoamide dehydrogenase (E3) component